MVATSSVGDIVDVRGIVDLRDIVDVLEFNACFG